MRHLQGKPGVVVLGSDFKALGVVRSLGRRGIPCVVIDNTPRSAWFSRYVSKHFKWDHPMDDPTFLSFLLSLGKEHHLERWVLFPMQDEAVEFVACHTQELAGLYQLVTQEWEIVRWANDKRQTYRMAQEVGIPYPRTWYPLSEEELPEIEAAFPVIIKPAVSTRLQYAMRLKALAAHNSEELHTQYHLATTVMPAEEIMVQEVIPGDGHSQYSVATFCKDGHIVMGMTARRTRQYPIDYGLGSSFVEAVEVPVLFELAEKLLLHMRVSGMVEVEFKHDRRDGLYKLLDINVRPWGWHTLCIACGLDFPYIQYCEAQGLVPEMATTAGAPHYDRHWVRLLTDLPAGLQEIRAGITSPGAYLRSLLGKATFSVFDWRDPIPVFGDFAVALSRSLRGFSRKEAKSDGPIAQSEVSQA
jgi:D-aspartate ligase